MGLPLHNAWRGGGGGSCPSFQHPRRGGRWRGAHRAPVGSRIGGEVHSMVWDPTGERLAAIIRGKGEALPPGGLFLADFTPKSSLQRAGSEPQRGEGPAGQRPLPLLPSPPGHFAPLSPLARELRPLCQPCPSSRCSRSARTAP